MEKFHLFVYGTLMAPQVMQAVTGAVFSMSPATLTGYQRFAMVNRRYPGIIASESGVVEGQLYRGISLSTLALLDAFEADEYRRDRVTVTLQPGEQMQAFVYCVAPACQSLLSHEPWDFSQFIEQHLSAYLEECAS